VNVDVTGSFVYVANLRSNNVSAYAINMSTGALAPVAGSPFGSGTQPRFVQVDPSGKFAYVVNAGSNDVWTYTIESSTGTLARTARGKVRARQAPEGVAFTAGSSPVTYTPKFAFVTGGTSYTVDASSGALTPIPGTTAIRGVFVAVDPSGRFAYVASGKGNDVFAYTIETTAGALTPIPGSPFAAGRGPQSVVVDPSGRFAYVANFLDNSVSGYTINSATGVLMPIPGSPFPASFPASVTVDPTGRFAYVTNAGNGSVSGYTISTTSGALMLIPEPSIAGVPPCSFERECSAQSSVAVDPTGKFAYVANHRASAVSGYTINAATGALTPITGSPFAAAAIATSVAVDPSGEFAYVTLANGETSGGVSGYTINATTGALTPVAGSPFDTTCSAIVYPWRGCNFVTVDPSGKFAYAVDFYDRTVGEGDVYGTTISTTGALTPIPGSPFTQPGGFFLYPSIAVTGQIH